MRQENVCTEWICKEYKGYRMEFTDGEKKESITHLTMGILHLLFSDYFHSCTLQGKLLYLSSEEKDCFFFYFVMLNQK